ncbi:MAG: tRNA (guanine(46)-N(7))-methyltransferase TrmB [Rhodobacteraceae bacterium]|nr:tRNA (guanine(46)-N(7))-methyltransferase TrmB [Paracoccaceae bacterium]
MTAPEHNPRGRRNFYGRRHGKALRPSQRGYLDEDLEALSIPGVGIADDPGLRPLDLPALFERSAPLWLEVGFGGGEHMVHMAARYPGIDLIGCEPFVNGVAMLLGKIRQAGVTNLRIHPGDVRDLFDVLPAACLDKCFLNYPDPWPKKKHHRRRFVTPEHLVPLARAMKPGAEFRIATDIPDYVRQAHEEVPGAGFTLVAEGAAPWDDWLSTRYEQKALREGRVPHYLTFRRG